MAKMYRDPDTAKRIEALTRRGSSRVNPDVEAAMRGEKGKRPKAVKKCPKCGKPMTPGHRHMQGRSRAEKMDRGERLTK